MLFELLSGGAGKQQPWPLALYGKQHLGASGVSVTHRPVPVGLKIWECKVTEEIES